MGRVKYNAAECVDRGASWDVVPCLCDCHYRRGAPCGDMDHESSRSLVRVTRRRRKPE